MSEKKTKQPPKDYNKSLSRNSEFLVWHNDDDDDDARNVIGWNGIVFVW